MSMFSEAEWENIPEVRAANEYAAPGPAAVSTNGAMADVEPELWDFPGEAGMDAASEYIEARLDRVELATMLIAAGLACIALAMLIYLRREA